MDLSYVNYTIPYQHALQRKHFSKLKRYTIFVGYVDYNYNVEIQGANSLMRELLNNVKQKDEARQRRHQEMREWKEKTLEVFKDAMASLLKKL